MGIYWINFTSSRGEASSTLVAVYIASNGRPLFITTFSFLWGNLLIHYQFLFVISTVYFLARYYGSTYPNMGFFIFITVQGLMPRFIPSFGTFGTRPCTDYFFYYFTYQITCVVSATANLISYFPFCILSHGTDNTSTLL